MYHRNAYLGSHCRSQDGSTHGLDTRIGERRVHLETRFDGGLIVRLLTQPIVGTPTSAARIGETWRLRLSAGTSYTAKFSRCL